LKNLVFRALFDNEEIPIDLLKLADPEEQMIRKYIDHSRIFLAELEGFVVGSIVLVDHSSDLIEIKNLAVDIEFQKQKIGTFLLENAINFAKDSGYHEIQIGTGNSSIQQFYLYQKKGFEFSHIKKDWFTNNYQKPIFENGIQCKHLVVFTKDL